MKNVFLSLAIIASVCSHASAALVYWDSNGGATTGAGTTPTGTWGTSNFWNTDVNGDAGTFSTTVGAGNTAVFSAGTDATGAYTVGVTGTQTVAGINIEEGTVTIGSGTADVGTGTVTLEAGTSVITASSTRIGVAAGGKYQLNGSATLRSTNTGNNGSFVDADAAILLQNNATLTVDYQVTGSPAPQSLIQTATVISGSGNLVKTGAGIIRIGSASTYSGSTTVEAGEFRLGNTHERLPATTDLIINGTGIFNMAALNQTVASLSGNGGSIGFGGATLTISGTGGNTSYAGVLANTSFIPATTAAGTTGVGRIIKNGNSTLELTGINTITGSVTLNAGGITVSSAGSLGGDTMDLTVNGGTLTLNQAAETVENLAGSGGSIVLNNAALSLISDPVASTTYAGTISGAGGLTKANALNGTRRTLTLTGNNSYDGNTLISGGLISVQHANALGSTTGYTEVNTTGTVHGLGAEVVFTSAAGSVTTNEPFRLSGAGSTNGGAISVIASAFPTISGPVTLIGDTTITASGSAGVTFDNANSITSLANQNLTLAGATVISTISGAINLGTGTLTKNTSGKWVLEGANTMGGTTISAGTLLANNSTGSATGSGAVNVNAGTLGGTGFIGGTVTVADNATLSPGASAGTLTLITGADLVLNSASQLAYDIVGNNQTEGGGINDLIEMQGSGADLQLNGVLTLTGSGTFGPYTGSEEWTLIKYTGALTGAGLAVNPASQSLLTGTGYEFAVSTATANLVKLVLTTSAVPEAGSFAAVGLVGLLSVGAVWIRRRMGRATVDA